jgi:hypothetical protein
MEQEYKLTNLTLMVILFKIKIKENAKTFS